MKIVQFKAKSTESGEWVEGGYFQFTQQIGFIIDMDVESGIFHGEMVHHNTVQQTTGGRINNKWEYKDIEDNYFPEVK